MDNLHIVDVCAEDLYEYGIICISDENHPGYKPRMRWLVQRFNEGLKIKLLKLNDKKIGYIEYIPGEYAWRAIDAPGYMVIHCIWVYPIRYRGLGYGSWLLSACAEDANKQHMSGIAVVANSGALRPDSRLFLKTGFNIVESSGHYNLLVKNFRSGERPRFNNWEDRLREYQGLHMVYCNQCPMISKAALELSRVAYNEGYDMQLDELRSAAEVQHAPSGFGTFSIVNDGKLLVDHYIGESQFKSIIREHVYSPAIV